MAIKRMQMYRKNLDTSETNLYPLTEAQYVSMENGQTVQEILSDRDSDKYTPVITNSSSTFKVGQGDNVDLSSSMKEGAYDSCVLKGKAMVNCIQEPSSKDVVLPYEFADGRYVTINDTKESGALGIELKGQTLVNLVPKMNNSGNESSLVYITEDEIKISEDSTTHRQGYWTSNEVLSKFKTNTTYTVIANITENTLTSAFMLINAYAAVGGDIASAALYVPVNFTGRFVGVFRTVSDFTNRTRLGFNAGSGNEGKLTMKNDMVILEGDWTNQELPFDSFFTGMASCKMPILHTVGKNLFDVDNILYNTWVNSSDPNSVGNGNTRNTLDFTKVKPNQKIIASGLRVTGAYGYDANKKFIEGISSNIITTTGVIIPPNVYYIRLTFDNTVDFSNAQLEYGSTSTTYEPHKSSILSLPEEVVLRSLPNGVCDTFNTRTGVYTQRVGEVVLNGSEGWNPNNPEGTTTQRFFCNMLTNSAVENSRGTQQYSCDRLRTITWNQTCELGLTVNGSGVFVYNNAIEYSASSVKLWLSQNPVRLQYELKTPIVTRINPSSTLKSWNTTTHIYSEIPENSLYPVLSHSNPTYPVILKPSTKYSIVANSYSNNHTNSAINFNLGGATASTTVGNRVTTITTPSTLSNELLTMSGRGNKLNNVMVIEGDVAGDESYFEGICDCKSPILTNLDANNEQSNTVTFDQKDGKTIVLRSLPNGTCDTLNVETGEYIQRIGEKVYDGSTDELWKLDTWWHNKITTIGAEIPIDNKGDSMFCDYFKVSSYDRIYKTDEEAITLSTDYNVLMLRISRSRLSAETLDGIKTWLQSNPITVQYQLATPIVKTVNLSGFPYAYKDGHVILESGSVEQSLTPKVEYSLVANRNGQIEANTKRVMAHQKELDNFEALMLTQIVQSHYDKAILQFDYEMQMMSLGGE